MLNLVEDNHGLRLAPSSEPGMPMQGEGQGYLLGLAQGHWEIDPKDRNNVLLGAGGSESINLGIALVVPAYIIRQVLYQNELKAMRSHLEESLLRRLTTVTD